MSKKLTNELVVKAVIIYFRKITAEHADYITTVNSLKTIFYLYATTRTIHVPTPIFTFSQWINMWVLFDSSTGFTRQPLWHICLPNLSGIWIKSQSYASMWSGKKAILQSKENSVTNIWSHEYHISVGIRWCALLLEIQLRRLFWGSGGTIIYLDALG